VQQASWDAPFLSALLQFHAYCMPVYISQMCCKYKQPGIKCLRVAYPTTMPIAVSHFAFYPLEYNVCPHRVTHFVRTFDALIRNNLHSIFQRCASSSNFLSAQFIFLKLFANLRFLAISNRRTSVWQCPTVIL